MKEVAIKMELGKTIVLRTEEDGTGLLSYEGGIFSLSEVSTLILNELYNKKSITNIAHLILKEYDVTILEVKQDMEAFFTQLCSLKIITREYLEAAKKELNNCEQGKDGECQMGQ